MYTTLKLDKVKPKKFIFILSVLNSTLYTMAACKQAKVQDSRLVEETLLVGLCLG